MPRPHIGAHRAIERFVSTTSGISKNPEFDTKIRKRRDRNTVKSDLMWSNCSTVGDICNLDSDLFLFVFSFSFLF
jgi:hypothetical protein